MDGSRLWREAEQAPAIAGTNSQQASGHESHFQDLHFQL